ncbi:membrane protein of unknown function [Nitrosotalea devaniterrae]|uniref:Uncharacterized protein n=1 Tax=Nitrosotalea devaniterrae TaxID=1078905 RepID=A0A128A4N8_9ARCH|nr:membrane protein of unknown function [Candidatus Nitrosotalea devanaterra]
MNEELLELVEQLVEFGYGDSLRLDSISNRLRNGELPYPSDQRYVDMLVSKYLYPHEEEGKSLRKPMGRLERKIQNVKQRYEGESKITNENLVDICPKCSSPAPRMFSFCSKCGAYHDEHNFVDIRKAQQKKEGYPKQLPQNTSMKQCIACDSRIFRTHEFCPICGAYQNEHNPKKKKSDSKIIRSYQALSLIGGIIGIITVFWAGTTIQLLSIILNYVGTQTPEYIGFMNQIWISLALYIISMLIPFAVRNTKATGTILVILSFATLTSAGMFGAISFALLLTAGIVSLRWKPRK